MVCSRCRCQSRGSLLNLLPFPSVIASSLIFHCCSKSEFFPVCLLLEKNLFIDIIFVIFSSKLLCSFCGLLLLQIKQVYIGGFNPNFHWAGKRFWLERFQRNWQCATTLYGGTRKIPERLRKKYLKILCQLRISVAISVLLFAIVHTV